MLSFIKVIETINEIFQLLDITSARDTDKHENQ